MFGSNLSSLSPSSPIEFAFWLPPLLELDWQVRYQSGLAALREAEVGIRSLEERFRQLQNVLISPFPQGKGVRGQQEVQAKASDQAAEAEDLSDPSLNWQGGRTWQGEQVLGMWSLAGSVDAGALNHSRVEGWDQMPLACLFSEMEAGAGLEEDRITPLLGQAARHFTLLLKQEPLDVLALYYRARVRYGTVRTIQLRQLPLAHQQVVYGPRHEYVRTITTALDDVASAIATLSEAFGRNEQGIIMPLKTGNRNQQMILNSALYECLIMQSHLKQQQRKWTDALEAITGAIALRPRKVSLYLERATLYHRLGRFEQEASDCVASLKIVAPQIPAGQLYEFSQKLNYLEMETDPGTVIGMVMNFWNANPMLLLV